MWKHAVVIAIFGLSSALAAQRVQQPKPDPFASLEVAPTKGVHDFGKALEGAVLEHVFRLRAGPISKLVIHRAKASCGCALSRIVLLGPKGQRFAYRFGDRILPRQEIEIRAILDTCGKRGALDVGIDLFTNDRARVHRLRMRARVEPFLAVEPAIVVFGELLPGQAACKTIEIRAREGERIALRVESARGTPPPKGLGIRLVAVAPDKTGRSARWRVVVDAGKELPEGPFGHALRFVSDRPVAGKGDVFNGIPRCFEATATVDGRVRAAPKRAARR